MKFSKNWLQDYIVETLPSDEIIRQTLNKKAFEVEEVVKIEGDTIFDIKILPNRAHDALGHVGMTRELCADFDFKFKNEALKTSKVNADESVQAVEIKIDDTKSCTRFMSLRIDNITIGDSPEWLKVRMNAIGQKSINNIVDITNYVQFSLNKPMHAYDARSINGALSARFAKAGETLTTLDDKELTLDDKTLVIADDEKVLGLAGIKGGKFSGVKSDTTSVIIESANFNPSLIRKTAQRYSIHTDASKRFENGIANTLVEEGLFMTVNLVKELFPEALVSVVTDIYPKYDTSYFVGVSLREVNEILGANYNDGDVEKTLVKLGFNFEKIIPENFIRENYESLVGAVYKNPSSMREDAPRAFSCSSLVSYLYKGIWMPSISIDKYVFSKKVTKEELAFGDLVFANSGEGRIYYDSIEFLRGTKVSEGVDHVGMYVGDSKIIHATKVKGSVVIETLDEFMLGRVIVGYGCINDNLKEERYVITVPSERLDIRIKEDLVEEMGRIIGYETLTPTLPNLNRIGLVAKVTYYENKIKEVLFENNFSEVITYTFGNQGEVEILKGLASDKEKLRSSLSSGVLSSLEMNLRNMPLLQINEVKIFEIGSVFTKDRENRKLSIACDDGKKKSNYADSISLVLEQIKRVLGLETLEFNLINPKPYCIEIDLSSLFGNLPEPTENFILSATKEDIKYKSFSLMPYIVRDVAFWASGEVDIENIMNSLSLDLCVKKYKFDEFSKTLDTGETKISYGYRFIFQSSDKTLTDEEANSLVQPVYDLLKEKGFEIR